MVLLEQVGFLKTFPEVPMEFRVLNGNPESRLSILVGTRNIQGLAGNVGPQTQKGLECPTSFRSRISEAATVMVRIVEIGVEAVALRGGVDRRVLAADVDAGLE